MNLVGPTFSAYLKAYDVRLRRAAADPGRVQRRLLARLLRRARRTWFGREHDFASIRTHADFAARVPIGDYAGRLDVYQRVLQGEPNVCWPGRTRVFALTSGTTAGRKYIPITKASRRNQLGGGLSIMAFVNRCDPAMLRRIWGGKLLTVGGRDLRPTGTGNWVRGIGDIGMRCTPWPLRHCFVAGRLNNIPDYEERIEKVAQCVIPRDIRCIGQMPTWMMVLFDRAARVAGVPAEGAATRLWPNLELIILGGMNLAPYRAKFDTYFDPHRPVRIQQVYPASEGFIAAQSDFDDPALELLVDNEVVFEFVPLAEWGKPDAPRLLVDEVEPDVPYCVAITTGAGLWAYDLGDIVRFTSLVPPKITFGGRHQHFMNAFGEHTVGEDITKAVAEACVVTGARITEFTVAPIYPDAARLGGAHQYLVEFEREPPAGVEAFAEAVDETLQGICLNYRLKRKAGLRMTRAEVLVLPRGTFYAWMRRRGKLGGQHKVPVCANDRRYADDVLAFVSPEVPSPGAAESPA